MLFRPARRFQPKASLGFTLAELLIALMILGLISVFTFPKVFSGQRAGRREAVFKETIATLSAATYQYCLSPLSSQDPVPYTYLTSVINTVKLCPTNSQSQGCIGTSPSGETSEAGFVMHNGASVVGLRTTPEQSDLILIDWDGPNSGSNTWGDDQMELSLNFTNPGNANGATKCKVAPNGGNTQSYDLYQAIFGR